MVYPYIDERPVQEATAERRPFRPVKPVDKNAPTVKLKKDDPDLWVQQIARAKRHPHFTKWYGLAKENYALCLGDEEAWQRISPKMPGTRGAGLVVNLVGANVEADVARTIHKNPSFVAKPLVERTWKLIQTANGIVKQFRDNRRASDVRAQVLTFGTKRAKLRQEARLVLYDADVTNVGWLKLGRPDGGDLSHTAGFPERFDDPNKTVPHGTVLHGQARLKVPYLLRRAPLSIIEDPDASKWEEVNWLAEAIIRPVQDVVEDPRYVKGVAALAKQGVELRGNLSAEDRDMLDPARHGTGEMPVNEFLKMWEIHYRIPDASWSDGYCYNILTIVEGTGAKGNVVLRHTKYPVDIGGFAYCRLTLKPVPGNLKGRAQIEQYKRANALDNYILTMIVEWAARNLPKWMVNRQGMTLDEVKALAAGNIAQITPVSGDVTGHIQPFPLIPIPPELMGVHSTLRGIVDELSGQSPAERLQVTGASAFEMKDVSSKAEGRSADRADTLKEFFAEVGEKFMKLLISMMPEGCKFEIPGQRGKFLEFDREMLTADCEIELDYASMMRTDPLLERKTNNELLMTLMKMPPGALKRRLNLDRIVERIIVSSGYPDPSEIYEDVQPEQWDPAKEHMTLLLKREPIKIDPNENFVETIPQHRAFVAEILKDPELKKAWLEGPDGKLPFMRLMRHIKDSEEMAIQKGMGKELGLQDKPKGEAAGGSMNTQGSGAGAGRPTTEGAMQMATAGSGMEGGAPVGV